MDSTRKNPAAVALGRLGGSARVRKGFATMDPARAEELRAAAKRKRRETMTRYELTFWGAAVAPQFPRYRRWHDTLQSAEQTAAKVRSQLESPDACPAIVFGPGCGADGKRIW